ncbi:MAG TPA: aminotransferase class IV [Myxococcales bacterium]|nr:aminotransferase class IV [Myxococcales bacterium]
MGVLCNVEGRLVPPEQALVPVLDRGFLYGDSVYEVVRTYAGRPFEMDRHLARMEKTAERIGLTLPRREVVLDELQRTLEAAGNAESYARIIVTRGLFIEIARAEGLILREDPHGPEALAAADEVFMTSTLREAMPVTSLVFLESHGEQLRKVADGKPGPVALRLRAAFRRYVERTHPRG